MFKGSSKKSRAACAGALIVALLSGTAGTAYPQTLLQQGSGKTLDIVFLNQGDTPGIEVDPEDFPAMKAAVDALNASGGIHGAKVHLTQCQSNGNENLAKACVKNLIADKNGVAAVNQFDIFPTVTLPMLAAAGMPDVGDYEVSAIQMSSPVSFPLTSGAVIGGACQADILSKDAHAKKLAISINSGNQETAIYAAANQEMKKTLGFGLAKSVPIPSTSADIQPTVEAATSGVQGEIVETGITDSVRFLQTAASLGLATPTAYTARSLPPTDLKSVGSVNGAYVASDVALYSPNSKVPGVQQFTKTMEKYAPSDARDDSSLNAYLSVELFAGAANSVKGPVTRTSLLHALQGLRNWSSGGIIPPYSAVTPAGPFAKQWPHEYDPYCTAGKISNGQIVPLDGGKFFNPIANGAPSVSMQSSK